MTRGYNNDPRRLVRVRRLKEGPRPPVPRAGPGPRARRGAPPAPPGRGGRRAG